MTDPDDLKRLQIRDAALGDDVIRRYNDPPVGAPNLLARTKVVSKYPTSAACFYACQPLTLLGTEVEGGSATVTATDATFFALNLGSTVPALGTQVLTTFVGNRWVFRYDS